MNLVRGEKKSESIDMFIQKRRLMFDFHVF